MVLILTYFSLGSIKPITHFMENIGFSGNIRDLRTTQKGILCTYKTTYSILSMGIYLQKWSLNTLKTTNYPFENTESTRLSIITGKVRTSSN